MAMGMTLKFLAGDEWALTEAFRGDAYFKFRAPQVILAEADFSLGLVPRDLNFLSLEAGPLAGLPPIDLRSQLTRGVDEMDHGLLPISKEWVAYIAALPLDSVTTLAERWAARMREFYQQPGILVTGDMKRAIRDLISLCQAACPEQVPVVHVWWL
jgi:hypothetical protein